MNLCFFVSDLHGHIKRYKKLFKAIKRDKPKIVFLGGDLLPAGIVANYTLDIRHRDFINSFLVKNLLTLKKRLKNEYPKIFLILGNDDPRFEEISIIDAASSGIWEYLHNKRVSYRDYDFYGYSFIPPSPFLLKDWEKYDVSRFVDVGCTPPTAGKRTIPVSEYEQKYSTIKKDLEKLSRNKKLVKSVFLFHAPPYKTGLDRADLDEKTVEHAPMDVHVGSIAIKRFIKKREPYITLHGHIHESSRLTGVWKEKIGKTYCFSAAIETPKLAIVKFDLSEPQNAVRILY